MRPFFDVFVRSACKYRILLLGAKEVIVHCTKGLCFLRKHLDRTPNGRGGQK